MMKFAQRGIVIDAFAWESSSTQPEWVAVSFVDGPTVWLSEAFLERAVDLVNHNRARRGVPPIGTAQEPK